MAMFSWCCCRDSCPPGNETLVEPISAPIGIGVSDLKEGSAVEPAAQTVTPERPVKDPRVPRMLEKEKLKTLVKDFAKAASVSGLAVKIADPKTGKITESKFELDKYLMWFKLTPPPIGAKQSASGDQPDTVQYMLVSVVAVVRGQEVLERVPDFPAHLAENTVLLDAKAPEDRVFFVIDDSSERRKFYMSIKIIRMSVDFSRKKS